MNRPTGGTDPSGLQLSDPFEDPYWWIRPLFPPDPEELDFGDVWQPLAEQVFPEAATEIEQMLNDIREDMDDFLDEHLPESILIGGAILLTTPPWIEEHVEPIFEDVFGREIPEINIPIDMEPFDVHPPFCPPISIDIDFEITIFGEPLEGLDSDAPKVGGIEGIITW